VDLALELRDAQILVVRGLVFDQQPDYKANTGQD
jgi:hypothetical protein